MDGKKLYKFLGLSVGLVISRMEPSEKKKYMQLNITYGTNNEYGFNYLRDNMVINKVWYGSKRIKIMQNSWWNR